CLAVRLLMLGSDGLRGRPAGARRDCRAGRRTRACGGGAADRLTTPLRDLRQRPGAPSAAGRGATEDEGQRFLEDMSVSEMSDKSPAGRLPYAPESEHNSPSSAGRARAEGCAEDPALAAELHHDSQVNTGRGAAQRAGSAEAP